MIEEIRLNNIATYTNPVIINPKQINYFYGNNGSGKTTLSNILGGYEVCATSEIKWDNNTPLKLFCYNKKFVEAEFNQKQYLSGIFTLGKDTKETKKLIEEYQKKRDDCQKSIESHNQSISTLKEQLNNEEKKITEKCWTVQQKFGKEFSEALKGFRGNSKKFKTKCIETFNSSHMRKEPTLDKIKTLYNAVFDSEHLEYQKLPLVDISLVRQSDEFALLKKRIIGSSESPIGELINYLNNSDWVRQGREYTHRANGRCPYCQQELPQELKNEIEAYFDESFEQDCKKLEEFHTSYITYIQNIINHLSRISSLNMPFLDYESFKIEADKFSILSEKNLLIINNKLSFPAEVVQIESLSECLEKINLIIENCNLKIQSNNEIYQKIDVSKKNCVDMIWDYFALQLKVDIKDYLKGHSGRNTGIEKVEALIKEQITKRDEFIKLIEEKEESITSTKHTANAINNVLSRFGFNGFKLAENKEEKGTYKIIRLDGSNAQKTLSEGEYNFITFLYFYHLVIQGSQNETGIITDRIVVIDDPISSLDSSILFIVTQLIRNISEACKDPQNVIKQIFILTHNVYFHKEITRLGSGKTHPKSTAFWVIKKMNNISTIVSHQDNPIKTSYQLLWAEVKEAYQYPKITIFNTMRRILEYYFNVIGGENYEMSINLFSDPEERDICRSLISWVNDGSHDIMDDYTMCYEEDALQKYLSVFELIFEKMHHKSHYDMMMGNHYLQSSGTIDATK